MNNLHLENYIKAQIMYLEYQNNLKQLSFCKIIYLILDSLKLQESQIIFDNKMNEFLNILKSHLGLMISKEEFLSILTQLNFDSISVTKFFLDYYNLNKNKDNNKIIDKVNENVNDDQDEAYKENILLKEKYFKALHEKDHKRHFQVYNIFKHKIKRMYRVDCMTRKINV